MCGQQAEHDGLRMHQPPVHLSTGKNGQQCERPPALATPGSLTSASWSTTTLAVQPCFAEPLPSPEGLWMGITLRTETGPVLAAHLPNIAAGWSLDRTAVAVIQS